MKQKQAKVSIKWKLFIYLLSFTGTLLVLLWFFQTVYLDSFYQKIKKNELQKASKTLLDALHTEDLQATITSIAEHYDINILITDSKGTILYQTLKPNSKEQMATKEFEQYYNTALINNGYAQIEVSGDARKQESPLSDPTNTEIPPEPNEWRNHLPPKAIGQSVIDVLLTKDNLGQDIVLILKSLITPVDATISTLRIQLLYISFILVILSLIMAFIMARRISSPIIHINKSAKELAKGNYQVLFQGKDYQEIAELSDTLNETAIELEKTELLRHELIANVSHDLRTPLTMIIAYSEMMQELPGENTSENLQTVIEEAKRLTALVNDMLDISKLQAGVAVLEMQYYDITESIESVLTRYSKLVNQDGYSIDFIYNGHVTVKADEFKISQVIYNFINNAINYTGSDKKIIVRQVIEIGKVRIEVTDTGAGISQDELPNIWERYYKVDKNHKRSITGSGLGLAIVKNILKLHSADYGVTSNEGIGSTFWFELDSYEDPQ